MPLLRMLLLWIAFPVLAQQPAPPDPELAARLGADRFGMRSYVLVILRSGPSPVPEGEARRAMFAGHFANMERLAREGRLVVAGPFGSNPDGWRGLFILATDDLDQARAWTETDPVIVHGEMVAEYRPWYGSAALMEVGRIHREIAAESP
ncbi:MAG: hypothetical protein KatS3mg126_1297 [Lysobacteraceae bacterium]|nr:MAG: hypothetical protein KatS3mg126_1297 [Xanthomonadaceae bacterium]